MSIRTVIVGLLAAVCGICATAGVMTWDRTDYGSARHEKIVVAKIALQLGSKVESNMLDVVDWPTDKIPSGAVMTKEAAIGKYCISPVFEGQAVLAGQLDDAPTTLQPELGFFAVTINTNTESSSLGKNLVAGNRVDVIWVMNKNHDTLGGPFSMRLLENVRVLAVGQNATSATGTNSSRDSKSITLEVKAKMDENLVLAQELGTLSLAMRNPNDGESVEPSLVTNIADLLEKSSLDREAAKDSPAMNAVEQLKSVFTGVVAQVEQLSRMVESLREKPAETSSTLNFESVKRIPTGMRAITIQTPSEATGVAGLLMPGHRVDVVVTWDSQTLDRFSTVFKEKNARSIVLLENVEVLAVDTQLIARDDNNEDKKMSRSVTLVMTLDMGRQISLAEQIGSLTLVLRGHDDSLSLDPRQVVNLDQYLDDSIAEVNALNPEFAAKTANNSVVPIRFNRGGANQDQLYLVHETESSNKRTARIPR